MCKRVNTDTSLNFFSDVLFFDTSPFDDILKTRVVQTRYKSFNFFFAKKRVFESSTIRGRIDIGLPTPGIPGEFPAYIILNQIIGRRLSVLTAQTTWHISPVSNSSQHMNEKIATCGKQNPDQTSFPKSQEIYLRICSLKFVQIF